MHLSIRLLCIFCAAQSILFANEWNTVYLASFPRSGNHWVRFLVEEATHITTSSVYRDKDYPHLEICFPWGGYCTDHGFERQCRFPRLEDPVLIKTHYPFLPRQIEPDPERAICLIRHPIDSFWSFHIYKGGNKDTQIDKNDLQEFVQRWRNFYEYWESRSNVLFVRYEDLQENPTFYLTLILQQAGYLFEQSDIERSVAKYPSQGIPLKHLHCYDAEAINMIRTELSKILTRYGYDL